MLTNGDSRMTIVAKISFDDSTVVGPARRHDWPSQHQLTWMKDVMELSWIAIAVASA